MKAIFASGLFLILASVASAQGASVFVKGDNPYCWSDVKDVVHRRATDVSEQDNLQILRAGHFSTAAGDLYREIQVTDEKNKKGEEGCRIYVDILGGASLVSRGQALDDARGNTNERIANLIAAEVEGMRKAREKKAKNPS